MINGRSAIPYLAAGWLAALLLAVAPLQAQESPALYNYPMPGLNWYTIETPHFNVVFHADSAGRGSSRTAQAVARIAEDIYAPITSLYAHEPDTRVTFILKDYEDYSNGASYFLDNKIEIWAPALNTPLRGDHNWLRNVITHEFTHMVQVQKTMKAGRRLPFLYFQLLTYEDVKRPDVLYGFPNGIVTYPFATLNNPAWFAEGTAQYQRTGLGYDDWDSHRDMLLRTRVLAGKELTLDEMGGFYSHTSLMREGVYNHGFAFTQYIAGKYGEDALRKISDALSSWGNVNVDQAMKDALGQSGEAIYREWMTALRREYETRTASIREHLVEGRLIEPDGFSNFYPRLSPDGTQLAYISNRGEDFNLSSLYVRSLSSGEMASYDLGGQAATPPFEQTCALGQRLKAGVEGAFGWRPDGKAIVYARTRDTRQGYLYSDLYELELASKKVRRLTRELRASAPAYAPDGKRIVFVGQGDGTTNLFVLDRETGQVTRITSYEDGSQVSEPVWRPSGEWIYFGHSRVRGRDLVRVRPDGKDLELVLASEFDERSPAFSPAGDTLYFSSDRAGIFNLYRMPIEGSEEPERLTNVLGGAFMPSVSAAGEVAFSQYQWDGYKIALLDVAPRLPEAAGLASYLPPEITQKNDSPVLASSSWQQLNAFDDTDLRPFGAGIVEEVRREGQLALPTELGVEGGPQESAFSITKYSNIFTAFSFYPVLRLDQYATRRRSLLNTGLADRTRAETLLRNTKVGFYVSSREVLEGLTMMGGLLLGPASAETGSAGDFIDPTNLLNMERDAFLQFHYGKGFGLIPQRWSPQISIELNNIRRNVEGGLDIEEFPCTACFPDTTQADLSYNLWEGDLAVRSKLGKSLLLEAGYRYSPYRVTTERFFSREANQSIESSSSRYFIGRALRLKAYFEALHPHRNDDVVPEGLRVEAGYEYEPGRLLDRFNIEDGLLVPEYLEYRNHRLTLDSRFGFRLPGMLNGGAHGLNLRLRGSTILGAPVDDFFNDYVGGLVGARGYPFYALGGNEAAWFQVAYHFPLAPRIHRQFFFTYIDKLYGRVYADAAAAWSGAWPGFGEIRKDVGAELRLALGSFYMLPTAVFVSATYSLDAFDFQLDEGFVTPEGATSVRYGNELLWHFGVLFSFDL